MTFKPIRLSPAALSGGNKIEDVGKAGGKIDQAVKKNK